MWLLFCFTHVWASPCLFTVIAHPQVTPEDISDVLSTLMALLRPLPCVSGPMAMMQHDDRRALTRVGSVGDAIAVDRLLEVCDHRFQLNLLLDDRHVAKRNRQSLHLQTRWCIRGHEAADPKAKVWDAVSEVTEQFLVAWSENSETVHIEMIGF